MLDGLLGKSDLLTRIYMLASVYTDIAERHRQHNDQEFADLKSLFNDLKIRLESSFTLTPQQMVCSHMYYHSIV